MFGPGKFQISHTWALCPHNLNYIKLNSGSALICCSLTQVAEICYPARVGDTRYLWSKKSRPAATLLPHCRSVLLFTILPHATRKSKRNALDHLWVARKNACDDVMSKLPSNPGETCEGS